MAVKHGLGRGLNTLIDETPVAPAAPAAATPAPRSVPVDRIRQNPRQPRKHMAPEALEEMVQSIRTHGVLQPLLVRPVGDSFELIAGERRLRAARQAGLQEVPVTLRQVQREQDSLELALIENLQREDLNIIEEAEGYRQLADQFAATQDEIADRVGKARATVANALRILTLPAEVKQLVAAGQLSGGHAKALLGVPIEEERGLLARRAVLEGWSVRRLEKVVARLGRAPRKPRASHSEIPASHLQFLADKLHRHFGTSVRVFPPRLLANGKKTKGAIEIDFFSNEDLTRILELLGLAADGV